MKLVICSYCKGRAELVNGSALFSSGSKATRNMFFWRCGNCKAHVGCHPGTAQPLGTLAKADLRRLRHAIHVVFDKRWQRGRSRKSRAKRSAAYVWLAEKLGIPAEQCHIGMFDKKMCKRALEVLKK